MIRSPARRRLLQLCVAGTTAGVAGCLGSDDEGDDGNGDDGTDDADSNGDDNESNGDGDEGNDRPNGWPDNPAFTPNPDADGPGGDVTLAMQFRIRDFGDASVFEKFEVDFDHVVLHDDAGGSVTVPVDRTIDFYEFELETDIVLVFDAAIPAGTYTDIDYEMTGVEIIHDEEGDLSDQFETPPRAPIGDEGREMEPGSQWLLMSTLHVQNGFSPTLEESLSVGSYSGPGDMSDPGYFAED